METCTAGAAPAPAPAGGTSQKKPAAGVASAATNGGQSWALLDPTIILDEEDEDPAAGSSAVVAVCRASNGSKVRASLRLAEPPASSYVQLHTDADVHVKPVLLSADGHMLLMRMVVARVFGDPPFTWYDDNYFVFQARPDSGKEGRLRFLPDPQQSTDDRDDSVGHIGIACSSRRSDKDDWVVAGFRTRVVFGGHGVDDDEVGILSRFRPSSNKWDKLKDLRIPFDDGKGLYRFVWHSDDVVACNGLMFWIDYHRGMIYCDVFEDSPKLQYIRLPGIAVWDQDHDYSNGRQLPQAYRRVGVSRGQLKFIDIDDGLFGTRKTCGFKITTWSLMMMTDLEWVWVKDHVLEVDHLWELPNFQESGLPKWVPEYPVVDKKDTNILHFILRGRQSNAQAWIITLDMSNEALMTSYHPFKNKLKLVFEDPSVDTTQIFCDTPLISCDFDHLTKPTGSWADTSEGKCETTPLSTSMNKKRKSSSQAEDNLEFSDTPDSDSIVGTTGHCQKLTRSNGTSLMPCLHRPVTEMPDPDGKLDKKPKLARIDAQTDKAIVVAQSDEAIVETCQLPHEEAKVIDIYMDCGKDPERAARSNVWKHHLTVINDDVGDSRVMCSYCHLWIRCNNHGGHLKVCKRIPQKFNQDPKRGTRYATELEAIHTWRLDQDVLWMLLLK